MRRFIFAAMVVVAFLAFSCKGVEPVNRYPHMVANADPVSAGAIDAALDRSFSTRLQKVESEVIFYPRLNSVALEFRYETVRYRQFWDEPARIQFAAALERYKTDYAGRNLLNNHRKTRGVYGKVSGRLEWEVFRLTRTRLSYPIIEMGYRFKENSPFFTTLMRSAKEEAAAMGADTVDSQQITMYFTRAQADELVKLFDQAYLMGLLGEIRSDNRDDSLLVDEYNEWEG